jgi:hypothetical protein
LGLALPWAFTAAMFSGAVQLFLLEPMLAKMLLPGFGGAPAVWVTCVLFFQVTLLAGYAYAHVLTTWLPRRGQVLLHVALLALCFAFLPINISDRLVSTSSDRPAVMLLGILAFGAGLPFFMLSSTTPLLQRWFGACGDLEAHDPYHYFAASNAGSLLALLAYPLLVEPNFSLPMQSGLWAVGFCLWVLVFAVCARAVWRSNVGNPKSRASEPPMNHRLNTDPIPRSIRVPSMAAVSNFAKLHWVLLAFVPSSLMLGCTSHLSADVASFPLMWIVPLALYLLSFIFAFARSTPAWVPHTAVFALPLALGLQLASSGATGLGMSVAIHLTTLFLVALVCHGEVAKRRPSTQYLTEYYLWIAFGGALGSCFNALLAPMLFSWVMEYPIALSFAAFLLPPLFPGTQRWNLRLINRTLPIALGCLVAAVFAWNRYQFVQDALLLSEQRTFFGVYRVVRDSDGKTCVMIHGHTWHGMQIQSDDPRERRIPLLYYSPTGPIGQVFFAFHGPTGKARIALIGLGIGNLAGYAESGQDFTFYEIDPGVAAIARDKHYFTYLADAEARGADVRVVLGDGRLALERDHDRRFGMIIVDAFTDDAIPTHLLTREAFKLYQDRLDEDGLLALHITNEHINLEPIVAELARDQQLIALIQEDADLSPEERQRGKAPSTWVVLARQLEHLGPLCDSKRWRSLQPARSPILWRDDYTNLLPIIRWN